MGSGREGLQRTRGRTDSRAFWILRALYEQKDREGLLDTRVQTDFFDLQAPYGQRDREGPQLLPSGHNWTYRQCEIPGVLQPATTMGRKTGRGFSSCPQGAAGLTDRHVCVSSLPPWGILCWSDGYGEL